MGTIINQPLFSITDPGECLPGRRLKGTAMSKPDTTTSDVVQEAIINKGSTLAARSPIVPCGPLPVCDTDASRPSFPVPTDAEVLEVWDRFAMPEHIREHSRLVAAISLFLAERAVEIGMNVNPQEVKVSALLHDLAKDYTIRHGGHHAQLGGAWTAEITGNPLIAQGVLHHIFWPWETDATCSFLPLAVIYGDKRVRHSQIVPVRDRYDDIIERYGKSEEIRARIMVSRDQALEIERVFSKILRMQLDASTFDGGRLVLGA